MLKSNFTQVRELTTDSMPYNALENGHSVATLPSQPLTDAEAAQLGEAKYNSRFASLVDTPENYGKFFLLDVETDEYEIGDDLLLMLDNAQQRDPDTKFYVTRIGRDAVFRLL